MRRQINSERPDINESSVHRQIAGNALAESSTFGVGRASLLKLLLAAACLAAFVMPAWAQIRVEGAGLEATPVSYVGACPGVIKFNGKIQANGRGLVKYRYERSDGATGPVEYLEFEAAGVKPVSTSWTLGDASSLPHFEGWEIIKILSPNTLESNRANFKLVCKGAAKNQSSIGASLRKSGQFYVLADLLEDSGLAQQLDQAKAFTLFAPNDAAFANLPAGKLDAYRRDPQQLRQLLRQHVMLGRMSLAGVAKSKPAFSATHGGNDQFSPQWGGFTPLPEMTNLNHQQITRLEIKCDKAECVLGNDSGARVVRSDIESSNGFVNEIDRVMFRPIFNPPL